MALSLSKKSVFGVSLGLVLSAPFLVWAGLWWEEHAESFGFYQFFLYLLAFLIAIVGGDNVIRLWREHCKDSDRNSGPP
jgi:hypothetical protein